MPDELNVTSQKIEGKKKRGRPALEKPLTLADRQQRRREKVTITIAHVAGALFQARKDEDWDAVEDLARMLFRL